MSETEISFLPDIYWRIADVNGFCKRKGPSFTFGCSTWKLEFVYALSAKGKKSFLILRRSGDSDKKTNFTLKATLTNGNSEILPSSIHINISSLHKYIVWEETDESIATSCKQDTIYYTNNYKQQLYVTGIIDALKCAYFKCTFVQGLTWPPLKDSQCEEQHPGSKSLDYSPCITSLCNDFGKLFNDHVMADVILECGDRKFFAHRAVLAARSEVFAAMFRDDMTESRQRCIEIKDVEPTVLEQLVHYMYSGDASDFDPDSVHKLFVAADKFGVQALKMRCSAFMIENPAPTSASSGKIVSSVNEVVLVHFANIKAVLCTEEWKKLSEIEPKFAHEAFKFFVSKSP